MVVIFRVILWMPFIVFLIIWWVYLLVYNKIDIDYMANEMLKNLKYFNVIGFTMWCIIIWFILK